MRSLLLLLLEAYRRFLSPLLPRACRFEPTCSVYMSQAIAEHGLVRGVWLGLRRLARCQPFSAGGYDPVPKVVAADGSYLCSHEDSAPPSAGGAALGSARPPLTRVPPCPEHGAASSHAKSTVVAEQ